MNYDEELGSIKPEELKSLQSEERGSTKSEDYGSIQVEEHGGTHSEEYGSSQSEENRSTGYEEYGSIQSEDQPLLDRDSPVIPPIDIDDYYHHVQLLDISCNKKWMAYVTYCNYDNAEIPTYGQTIDPNIRKKIVVTRRRFTAIDQETQSKELGFSGDLASTTDLNYSSLDITDLEDVKLYYGRYCAFLSISNDGKYVALSFYKDKEQSRFQLHKGYENTQCLIFDMDRNLSDLHRIKCPGRAVFLNDDKKHPLAIININNLEIYAEFPEKKTVTRMFDMSPLSLACINGFYLMVNTQASYISNASWSNNPCKTFQIAMYDDISVVMTLTRFIRHNILITPFSNGGAVRIWSILDEGARFSSFPSMNQPIMAISTDYTYAAAYVENSRSVNIYNVKSGLLVYHLKSREKSSARHFKISHIRFCYDARYVAVSGLENDEEVAFEVWHLETEISIYRRTEKIDKQVGNEDGIAGLRRVEPFVARELKDDQKCLKGYYTTYPDEVMTIMCVELKIDQVSEDDILNFVPDNDPRLKKFIDETSPCENSKYIRYDGIIIGDEKYTLCFSKHTVELWHLVSNENLITDEDELLYIRAYKGPDYGLAYSFRETWEINDFDSIRYIGGNLSGRLIVNISMMSDGENSTESYHTEEIFLPLEEHLPIAPWTYANRREKQSNYHKLESVCQALHYIYMGDHKKSYTDPNWDIICEKTNGLARSCISDIKNDFNFFLTLAGSRLLAMLASFKEGREVIRFILESRVPISFFSYPRSQSEIDKKKPPKCNEEEQDVSQDTYSEIGDSVLDVDNSIESNMPDLTKKVIFYRSSMSKPPYRKSLNTTIIAPNENALTVLIDEESHDLYKLLFNRIISDSKSVGPNCFSALTDTLLNLEEERKYNLLLSSSAKLSYLEVDYVKSGLHEFEYRNMIETEALHKRNIIDIDHLKAHATMEQIKMYKGHSLRRHRLIKKFIQWSNLYFIIDFIVYLYTKCLRYTLKLGSSTYKEELRMYTRTCLVPIAHFNSYDDFYVNQPRHTNVKEEEYEKKVLIKGNTFARVALDHHINNMFHQENIVLELLLEYKWKAFARYKFILICFIHAVYYVSYGTGVLFAPELYSLNPNEGTFFVHPYQIVSIALMITSLLILIVQKVRRFSVTKDKFSYFFSGYNLIDMCALVLPLITLVQLYNNWSHFFEVCSVATFIIWIHAILRLRAISHFGVTLDIITQLSKKIAPLLLIMLLIILAFIQSCIVLLRRATDDSFSDNFLIAFLSKNDSDIGGVTLEGQFEFTLSSDNEFSSWFTVFYKIWLLVYGIWVLIFKGGASSLIVIGSFAVLSITAILIFFNTVTAIMSSVIDEVDSRGKKVWIIHFTNVISEIELLWCSQEKYNLKYNPTSLCYLASKEAILEQREKLEEETAKLKEKLKNSEIPLDHLYK